MACLKVYSHVVKFYQNEIEKGPTTTSLEADEEILESGEIDGKEISWNMRMAVLFRAEHKRLLRAQLEILDRLLKIVRRA